MPKILGSSEQSQPSKDSLTDPKYSRNSSWQAQQKLLHQAHFVLQGANQEFFSHSPRETHGPESDLLFDDSQSFQSVLGDNKRKKARKTVSSTFVDNVRG